MKTIFTGKNKGKVSPLYILFAIAVLSFVAVFFYSSLLPRSIFMLVLLISLIAMMFLGGLIIDKRSGPPW